MRVYGEINLQTKTFLEKVEKKILKSKPLIINSSDIEFHLEQLSQ